MIPRPPRWRSLPLTLQMALVTLAIAVAWTLGARSYFTSQDARQIRADGEARALRDAQLAVGRMDAALLTMERARERAALVADPAAADEFRAAARDLAVESTRLQAPEVTDSIVRRQAALFVDAVRAYREWVPVDADGLRGHPGRSARQREDGAATLLTLARRRHVGLLRAVTLSADQASTDAQQMAESDRRANWRLRLAVLATLLLLILVNLRMVTKTLSHVVDRATELAEGRYSGAVDVRLAGSGGSAELIELQLVFDRLAIAIESREQILQSDIEQLREVERLKTDFVSTVSHELRTPLTSMRGALSLVLAGAAGEVSEKTRSLLQIALKNTERLIRLINDILDIEKIESGHVEIRRDRCDLVQVLHTTLNGLEAYVLDAGVRLTLESERAVTVTGDGDRLVQIFTNLVSNAVKFTPRGGEVRIRLVTDEGVARVSVIDQGPGIPPEFQARIFGKFQQAARADARRSGGTGLGLAIARAIVELHGGSIGFDTAAGAGTTFTVELPFMATPDPLVAAATGRVAGRHLLIVDDDVGMLSVLQTLCQPLGSVIGVRTAEEAITLTRQEQFDALIVDPDLPGMSGLRFVRRLRSQAAYHFVPVLVFSSKEYTPEELDGITLSSAHAFVKSRDREQDLIYRLLAVLTARAA